MSSDDEEVPDNETETIFVAEDIESSEDPPMDEWPSLILEIPEENVKKKLYEQGLYHPGSGEICGKYIAMSDSSIFRHLYYNYPAVHDPGIKKALLYPEPSIIYADDGQELYLTLCKEMDQAPVRIFARGLLGKEIDLSFYCVDPKGVRPMAMALRYNKAVSILNLSGSFLSDDACYHLGDMLTVNSSLIELNLSGCRIKSSGAQKLFNGLIVNRSLKTLNLNSNQLGDEGVEFIAKAVFQGLDIQKMFLSYNDIGAKGTSALAEAFETHNKFVELDLSWNNLNIPAPTHNLLAMLGESKNLQNINLSWNSLNGPRIGSAIKFLFTPNIRNINLSNNKLEGEAISNLIGNLGKAKKLLTLDLSFNPLSPADALLILSKMRLGAVKVQKILLDNVFVTGEFLELLKRIETMKARSNFSITYGGIVSSFKAKGPDPRDLILNRADYLSKRSKKHSVDIALVVLQLIKNKSFTMRWADFATAISDLGASLDEDLVNEMCNVFATPQSGKLKTIDVMQLADFVKRKWPDRQLPPTPPPEPEPVVEVIEPKTKKGKGKGKK